MPSYQIEAAVLNNMGNVRQNNEDSFYLNGTLMEKNVMDKGGLFRQSASDALQIYAVCDGMGGLLAGEEASYTAVKSIDKNRAAIRTADDSGLMTLVRNISDAVYEIARKRNVRSGSTLTMCIVKEDKMQLVNVGDSRIYKLHNHKLEQLTIDHSEVQRMISLGIITKEEAREHPKRHMINQYLGISSQEIKIDPSVSAPIDLKPGDCYMLCSDGLTDMVEDSKIEELLNKEKTATGACEALVKQALRKGGKDNVTVMCLNIGAPRKELKLSPLHLNILMGLFGTGFLLFVIEWLYRL